jgi:hypothetical protein
MTGGTRMNILTLSGIRTRALSVLEAQERERHRSPGYHGQRELHGL